MRQAVLLGVAFCCLFLRARSDCDLSDQQRTDKTFPDLLSVSTDGYQLSTEFANKKTRETVFVEETYNTLDDSGYLRIHRKGDFKQFVYFNATDEAFIISGSTCEVQTMLDTPPFQEGAPFGWLQYEDTKTILGPSGILRHGYVAWKNKPSDVGYYGQAETDNGILLNKWKQCIKREKSVGTIEYYFADDLWHNELNFTNLQIPVRVIYKEGSEDQTLEFFDYQPFLSKAELTYNVPEGYGCNRTAKNGEDIPVIGERNHLLNGEMVFHSINRDAKKYSRFISTFQIAYHSTSEMIAYSYSPWKKGSANNDGTIKTKPYTRVVWDNRNSLLYLINLADRSCAIERDSQFYPSFELPDDNDGNIDLLDPNILISNDGFKYLGDRKERDIPVFVFEKEVSPMFLGDREAAVGVITRIYSSDATTINTGNHEKNVPVRITIQWYDDIEKTKIRGYLVVNIFSYSNDVPNLRRYFNVMPCFRDYDASMWIEVIFPPMGVTTDTLIARSKEIESEFLGVLYTKTETTPIRIPRVFVDVTEDDFSVNALLLERPPYPIEFDLRGNYEITNWNVSIGIVSRDECMKSCVEYNLENGENCRGITYCGSTCYLTTVDKAVATENAKCKTYDRSVVSESLPSMENLAKSIRKLVVTNELSIGFEVNVADEVKYVGFRATSFGDTVGDFTERIVTLPDKEKFQISMAGMRLPKGKDDEFQPVGKYSLTYCMQICLNNPHCETMSYCKGTDCVISTDVISDISIERIVKNRNCMIYARDYIQAYDVFPGVILTRSADEELTANTPDACAKACTKENEFTCLSFDFCEEKNECLLHVTHYIELKRKEAGIEIKENCTHYSKKFVYDYKSTNSYKVVGDVAQTIAHNTVEECAEECTHSGTFNCTAFDFCEGTEAIDNKCYLISTPVDQIKVSRAPFCRHYVHQGLKKPPTPPSTKNETRYSKGLAGGLGFLFFVIGAVIGLGATYFFAFKYANRG